MPKATIQLNPLGPHYYSPDISRNVPDHLLDNIEDMMNTKTVEHYDPTSSSDSVPLKKYVTAHVPIAYLHYTLTDDGKVEDMEITMIPASEGEWYNEEPVHNWDDF